MIKVFYFYCNIDKYYSSTPITNNIRILFENKLNNIELTPFIEFIDDLDNKKMLTNISKNLMDSYLLEAIEKILILLPDIVEKYEKIIFLGFHPKPFNPIQKYYDEIKKYKNVFTYLWQDDLQAYFKTKDRIKKLDYVDKILTPSPVYFKNVAPNLLSKTSFLFYSMNFDFIKDLNKPFDQKENKIILSGCINKGYKIRKRVYNEIKKNKKFASICDHIPKPFKKEYNYKNNENLPFGYNYYKILDNYKGAFFGYYEYPMNFNLAKIIEILSVGTIGFFEESPLLKEELQLEPYVHYVPCTKDGELITKTRYYKYFFENSIGEQIAKNGRDHILNKFSNENQIQNFIRIFNS